MIELSTTITGGQIATAVADDAEEFAYMLYELATEHADDISEVGDYLSDTQSDAVVKYLRLLADKIDETTIE
ncbi:MAG: hypothetical protein AAFU41_00665 [Pseudomonadota bacterium]